MRAAEGCGYILQKANQSCDSMLLKQFSRSVVFGVSGASNVDVTSRYEALSCPICQDAILRVLGEVRNPEKPGQQIRSFHDCEYANLLTELRHAEQFESLDTLVGPVGMAKG